MLALRAVSRCRFTPLLIRTNAALSTEAAAASSVLPHPPPPPINSRAKSDAPQTSANSASNPSVSSTKTTEQAQASGKRDVATTKTGGRGRRRRRIVVKRRPPISLTNPRKWNPPVKPGALPVYDEALKLIKGDSARLKKELRSVQSRVSEIEKELPKADGEARLGLEEESQSLQERVKILEVQSEINLPWVRWYAANGMGV